MPVLLQVNASPRGGYSVSRQLSEAAVNEWKAKNPEGRVIERDLAKTALSFVDLDWIMGAFTPPEQREESHKKALAISDELIAEVKEADTIVLATPMYNFAAPAAVKAWIDHIVRVGKTFAYDAGGAKGLLTDKPRKVIVVVASGGVFTAESEWAPFDFEVPYLRFIFGFIGLTDVTFVQAGGTTALAQGKISAAEFLPPFQAQVAAAV